MTEKTTVGLGSLKMQKQCFFKIVLPLLRLVTAVIFFQKHSDLNKNIFLIHLSIVCKKIN